MRYRIWAWMARIWGVAAQFISPGRVRRRETQRMYWCPTPLMRVSPSASRVPSARARRRISKRDRWLPWTTTRRWRRASMKHPAIHLRAAACIPTTARPRSIKRLVGPCSVSQAPRRLVSMRWPAISCYRTMDFSRRLNCRTVADRGACLARAPIANRRKTAERV